jgi:hypothetical protein
VDNPSLLYCATDKEIFDVLMSSRQHFSEGALRDLGRTRGLLFSSSDEREVIADRLSATIFGYEEIRQIQAEFDRAGRGEKTTSFRLNGTLTKNDIKAIAEDYRDTLNSDDTIITYVTGGDCVAVDVKYTEADFSKTRLRQRQAKEAHIEFKVGNGHTIVTLPATDKARSTAELLTQRIYARMQSDVGMERIDMSTIADSALRSKFFTDLISRMSGFKMQNVTRVKVDLADDVKNGADNDEEDDSGDGDEISNEASREMLGVLRAAALQGQSLLASKEYQSLHRRGFFITNITWSGKRIATPYEIVEFDAGFAIPSFCTEFKYSVRGWMTQKQGDYTRGFRPIPPEEKKVLSH